jgi:hypothetical protein
MWKLSNTLLQTQDQLVNESDPSDLLLIVPTRERSTCGRIFKLHRHLVSKFTRLSNHFVLSLKAELSYQCVVRFT